MLNHLEISAESFFRDVPQCSLMPLTQWKLMTGYVQWRNNSTLHSATTSRKYYMLLGNFREQPRLGGSRTNPLVPIMLLPSPGMSSQEIPRHAIFLPELSS